MSKGENDMIFLTHDNATETRAKVNFIHYMPFDERHGLGKTEEELSNEGILVERIPSPEVNDKAAVLYVNPQTKELWYEYVVRPLTPEEKIAQLEEQLRITQETIDFLLGV